MNGNAIELIKTFKKEEHFASRYFDRQIAYRYLFRLADGYTIESGAYQHFWGNTPATLAIDISSMVGCPKECKFCASASIPYVRALTANEMLSQVVRLVTKHDVYDFPKIVCSFQGIGETSLIDDLVVRVSRMIMRLDRRIAISLSTTATCLRAFKTWRDSEITFDNLQISYSGTTDEQINFLTPGLPEFDKIFREAKLCLQSPNFEKVKFNYIVIQGFNDSEEDISRLIMRFQGTSFIIKISILNLTESAKFYDLVPITYNRALEISDELKKNNIQSYVYGARNATNVSCGQLTFSKGQNQWS
jgi:23S rRNA (adenine2503-C2)-methyltransferase